MKHGLGGNINYPPGAIKTVTAPLPSTSMCFVPSKMAGCKGHCKIIGVDVWTLDLVWGGGGTFEFSLHGSHPSTYYVYRIIGSMV